MDREPPPRGEGPQVSVCVCVFAAMRGNFISLCVRAKSAVSFLLCGDSPDGGVSYYSKSWNTLQIKAPIDRTACVDVSWVTLTRPPRFRELEVCLRWREGRALGL